MTAFRAGHFCQASATVATIVGRCPGDLRTAAFIADPKIFLAVPTPDRGYSCAPALILSSAMQRNPFRPYLSCRSCLCGDHRPSACHTPRGSIRSLYPAIYMEKIVTDREVAHALVSECLDEAWSLILRTHSCCVK
jgi:hypothetical protein